MSGLVKSLSRLARVILYSCLFFSAGLFIAYSAFIDNGFMRHPGAELDINHSKYHSISERRAISKSRESAVQVISISFEEQSASTFSGTYVKSNKNYFVLTVAHGLQGDCDETKVIYDDELYDCVKMIHVDQELDYALIQVEEIPSRTAIKIPREIPNNREWRRVFTLLHKVVYTGYPNTIGPLTFSGEIAGVAGYRYIYVNSYAWEGSSGSGVFDSDGNFIGYIVAVDIGKNDYGVQILNNLVLVIPSFHVDWGKTITEVEK
tara:strand:- start:1133 stop:1921 length:789 start_codon:yes stop_codon:yes gene_type:complete